MNNKIVRIEKTCEAYPAQWEIKLYNGKMIYVRYRSGYLSICISLTKTDDIYDAVDGKEIFEKKLGDTFDGVLSEKDMLKYLNNTIR